MTQHDDGTRLRHIPLAKIALAPSPRPSPGGRRGLMGLAGASGFDRRRAAAVAEC